MEILKNALEVTGILITAVGAIFSATWKFLIKPKIFDPIQNISLIITERTEKIHEIQETLKEQSETLKELRPNGGGSLKDKIDKISKTVTALDDSVNYIRNLSVSHLNLLSSPIWQSDKEGNNIFINEAYKEFFEIDLESAVGYKWTALIHKEDVKEYIETWQDTLKYKTDKDTIVRAVTYRTKQVKPCKVSWRVTIDSSGDILYIVGRISPLNS